MTTSVIVPTRNQAEYIGRTLDSILNQTCAPGEVVVVDGVSTDGTAAVLQRFRTLENLRIVSEPDQGQADAVNKGIGLSTGDIIGWLNSDDLYFPWAIEHAKAAFEAAPEAVVVYGDYVKIDQNDRIVALRRQPQFDLRRCVFTYITVMQPAAFIRRSALDSIGGLDISFQYAMDHDLFARLGRVGGVLHIPEYLAAFRLHASSKSVASSDRFASEDRRVAEKALARKLSELEYSARRYSGYPELVTRMLLDGCIPSRFGHDRVASFHQAVTQRWTMTELIESCGGHSSPRQRGA